MALRLGSSTPSKLYLGATEVTKAYLGASEVYSSAPAAWTPADLGASLALWLDAEDTASITLNGSNVAQWDDKSGNGRNFSQGTAASQPTYNATALSGKPALVFNGSSTFMSAGDTLDIRTNNITMMAVAQYATSNQSGVLIAKSRFAAGTGRYFLSRTLSPINFGTGTQYATMSIHGSAVANAQSLDASTAAGLFGGEWNRAVGTGYTRVWRNGIATATTAYAGDTADFDSTDQLWIGAYQNGTGTAPPTAGSYLNGQMSEVVVTLSTLSTANRQNIEGYLAWKWGLEANLPVDHPYKNTPPTV